MYLLFSTFDLSSRVVEHIRYTRTEQNDYHLSLNLRCLILDDLEKMAMKETRCCTCRRWCFEPTSWLPFQWWCMVLLWLIGTDCCFNLTSCKFKSRLSCKKNNSFIQPFMIIVFDLLISIVRCTYSVPIGTRYSCLWLANYVYYACAHLNSRASLCKVTFL